MSDTAIKTPDKIAAEISAVGERVLTQLKTVFDPEIPVNIYDLGLIYKIDVTPTEENTFNVAIDMTLTTPNCPVAGQMPSMVQMAVKNAKGVNEVAVNLVWEPPWEKSCMSDEALMQLNMF